MRSPEFSEPQYTFTPEATPSPVEIEFELLEETMTQAFRIADEIVDPLWNELLDGIQYQNSEQVETAASHLREAYYFMYDALAEYKRQKGSSLTQEQINRIIEQVDICYACRVRLRM